MSILLAILALGILIVLHELGHFLVARWCGMKVYEFAVGFGPRLFYFKHGETEYSLRLIFLGGYVRVAGMHPAEEDAQDPRSFLQSSPGKRFAMIFAGPLANYITAFFVFLVLFGIWGIRDNSATLQKPASQAAVSMFQPGDQILSVNGKPIRQKPAVYPLSQIRVAFQKRDKESIGLKLLRNGRHYNVTIPRKSKEEKGTLGLRIESWQQVSVKSLHSKSRAVTLGLEAGDMIRKLNGKPLKSVADLRAELAKRKRRIVTLTVERRGKNAEIKIPIDPVARTTSLGVQWDAESVLRVTDVKPGSLSQAYGLQKGDMIVGLNKKSLRTQPGETVTQQMNTLLAECGKQKKPLVVKIRRAGKEKTLTLSPDKKGSCGGGLTWQPTGWVMVMRVLPNTTAKKIGLKSGDRLLAIDGQPLVQLEGSPFGSIAPLHGLLQARTYRSVELLIERDGKRITKTAPMAEINKKGKVNYLLGFQPQIDYPRKTVGVAGMMQKALWETWMWNVRIWEGLSRIFSGREKANLTGPVGIVRIAQSSVQQGAKYFLFFLAIISIHLAFFNLLPIPALDGGRLMFLFSQQLIRLFGGKEEWAIRAEMVANLIGFLLLFGLLIFITFKDIQKLF
ncbi:MAG: RIP metalloprotease RseP [Deltaproteobacteria bacterium]|nr:MAG: RIP metalloprotease RseP [Deltaproteobacteria bacterium]